MVWGNGVIYFSSYSVHPSLLFFSVTLFFFIFFLSKTSSFCLPPSSLKIHNIYFCYGSVPLHFIDVNLLHMFTPFTFISYLPSVYIFQPILNFPLISSETFLSHLHPSSFLPYSLLHYPSPSRPRPRRPPPQPQCPGREIGLPSPLYYWGTVMGPSCVSLLEQLIQRKFHVHSLDFPSMCNRAILFP